MFYEKFIIFLLLGQPEGWVIVEWDTGFKSHYRFGSTRRFSNKYDIELCNDPRILGNELIATGCLVTRGQTFLLF